MKTDIRVVRPDTPLSRYQRSCRGILLLVAFLALPLWASAQPEPATATAQVAPATPQEATPEEVILDVMDAGTEALVESASKVIEETKKKMVEVVGGEASTLGAIVDRVLSVFTVHILGRPIWLYFFSLVIVLAALFLRHMIGRRFGQALKRLAARTKTTLDEEFIDALLPCVRFAVALVGIYIAFQVFFAGEPLQRPPETTIDRFRLFFRTVIYIFFLGNVGWALVRLSDVATQALSRWAALRGYAVDKTFIPIGRRTIKFFIVAVIALQALYYLQFDAVVAGLLGAAGVSGLAMGLAAQDTLKNFFGSMVLLLDRPFSVGDWVIAGGTEGYVESVGLRSTKIRTFEKTVVTIPNSSIVDRDIQNMHRRPVRRIKMTIGVTYSTKPGQMEELLRRIRDLLKNDPGVWQGYMLVRFTDFGESSLNVFLYYFSKSTVWDEYLEVRERINLNIMRIIEELGLEFAFPSRTVYLETTSKPDEQTPPS